MSNYADIYLLQYCCYYLREFPHLSIFSTLEYTQRIEPDHQKPKSLCLVPQLYSVHQA